MKNNKSEVDLVNVIIRYLEDLGVELRGINTDPPVTCPTYYIRVNKSKIPDTLDVVLGQVYGVLWTLTYGKLTDENRSQKIDLQYDEYDGEG